MKILKMPRLRQTFNYDCGAITIQSVLAYYGIEIREDSIMKMARTKKSGTKIKNIIEVAEKHGLKCISKEMTINEVKEFIKKGIPVILALQAWTEDKKVNWEKKWKDGHYVVAIGYKKDTILFNDPSSFNITYLKYDELEKRWHDMDVNGKKYYNYGIAIYGKKPKYKKKIKHMN